LPRRPLIAGNWKMNNSIDQALTLGRAVAAGAKSIRNVDIAIFPPYLALPSIAATLGDTRVRVGAQNLHPAPSGAFTGEISPPMLSQLASMVILGHSERRALFGESSKFVGQKVRAALDHHIIPVLCVGEQLEHRQAAQTEAIVGDQVRAGLSEVTPAEIAGVVIAYEPVWAIGTGLNATPEQADETIGTIRGLVAELYDDTAFEALRILYGGSVNPANWRDLAARPHVDGALVGGASLISDDFLQLIHISASL